MVAVLNERAEFQPQLLECKDALDPYLLLADAFDLILLDEED